MESAAFWAMIAGAVVMAIVIASWAACQLMRWNYYRKQNAATDSYLSGLDKGL